MSKYYNERDIKAEMEIFGDDMSEEEAWASNGEGYPRRKDRHILEFKRIQGLIEQDRKAKAEDDARYAKNKKRRKAYAEGVFS